MGLEGLQRHIDRIISAPSEAKRLLQEAHDEINALGGGHARDEHERGVVETVNKALAILDAKIEELR